MSIISQTLLIICASISCLSWDKQNISVYSQTHYSDDSDPLTELFDSIESFSRLLGKPMVFSIDAMSDLHQNGIGTPQALIDLINDGNASLLFQAKALTIAEVAMVKNYLSNGGFCESNNSNKNGSEEVAVVESNGSDSEESKGGAEEGDGLSLSDIDGWKPKKGVLDGLKKEKRVTLGFGCAKSCVKELNVIYHVFEIRSGNGQHKQKGRWIHKNVLNGSESTLRRKKPLFKLLAYDPEGFLEIEKSFKYKDGVLYMQGDFAAAVTKKTKELIQAGTAPKNPIFYQRYVDVFGDKQDKDILRDLLKDDRPEDQE